jgi:hypothetical protein
VQADRAGRHRRARLLPRPLSARLPDGDGPHRVAAQAHQRREGHRRHHRQGVQGRRVDGASREQAARTSTRRFARSSSTASSARTSSIATVAGSASKRSSCRRSRSERPTR